jgi:hypothetical protein
MIKLAEIGNTSRSHPPFLKGQLIFLHTVDFFLEICNNIGNDTGNVTDIISLFPGFVNA